MPEFIMPHDNAPEWKELDSFTQHYVEAMFFTETGTGDDGDLEDATFSDLAPETLERIKSDCAAFQRANGADIESGPATEHATAGHDFWYTRNGHGAGFWDGNWREPFAQRLTEAAQAFGEVWVYRGDDGRIHLT